MRLSDLPLDRPVSTLMLLVSLVVLGTVALFRLGLDFFPPVETPFIEVTIPFPGSHPLEGLREVLQPLEAELAAIPDLKNMNSSAESNQVTIRANFEWSAPLELRKMEVREAVERMRPKMPAGVGRIRVETYQGGPGGGAVLQGRLSARRSLSESWDLLDRRIRRPLERIKGVARVDLGGVEPQEVRVELDPAALRRHNLQPPDLLAALEAANVDMDLGAVHGDVLLYTVRSLGRLSSVEAVSDLRLGSSGVRVRDVARVTRAQPDLTYGRHLNGEFAISLDVFKEPTANTVEVVDRVLERIEEIKRDPELKGITLLVWNDAGAEIKNSLSGLLESGLYGGILAVAILFFFLRRLRTTLIVAVAIPFSLLVTCGGMYALGAQFNVLTMLGLMLGVGMLVDNAVVVIENIYRLQSQGLSPREAAREGLAQVSLAVVASTATTVMVWSWLFTAERKSLTIYMGEVATTICLAVGCSLLISLTFIPLAAARLPAEEIRPGFMLQRMIPAYRRVLAWTLRHRFSSLVILLALAGSAAYPIMKIEKSGEPKTRELQVQIVYRAHDPATKEIMEGYVNQVEAWLVTRKQELGYDNLYSFFEENGFALTFVYLPREQASEARLDQLRDQLRQGLPQIPGVKLEVGDREWWRPDRGGKRVVVALHGEDPEYLQELALEVEKVLKRLPDVKDVRGPSLRGQNEARILVDPEKARALGLTPRMVAETVAFAYRGRSLRRFQAPEGELEMRLGLPDDLQPGVGSLVDLPIIRGESEPVPLGSVAEVQVVRSELEVQREDRQTTTRVGVEFEDPVNTDEGKSRVTAAMKEIRLPEGYGWDFGSWGRHREEGLNTMMTGVLLSLLVVLMLMASLFESITQPLAILITLPLAFFGGFWTLWILGFELDAVAFMGVIILIGIVVNNGIVLVDHVNTLRREGRPRVDALLEGCGDRLRPVLMTALTTLIGLLPLAVSQYTVADAYINSLALIVIGGLATSTIFTLLALPVWYTALEDVGAVVARAMPRLTWSGPTTR